MHGQIEDEDEENAGEREDNEGEFCLTSQLVERQHIRLRNGGFIGSNLGPVKSNRVAKGFPPLRHFFKRSYVAQVQ